MTLGGARMVNGAAAATVLDRTGVATCTVNTVVGATVSFEGSVDATLVEAGVLGPTPHTGSYALDLTASFDLAGLTPGVGLTFGSNATHNLLSASAQPVGVGCGAAPPVLAATLPVLGGSCLLTATGAPVGAPTFFGFVFGGAIALPSGPCTLHVDPAVVVLQFAGAGNAAGLAAGSLAIPANPNLAGTVLTSQAMLLATPGPFLGIAELSNAVVLRLGL